MSMQTNRLTCKRHSVLLTLVIYVGNILLSGCGVEREAPPSRTAEDDRSARFGISVNTNGDVDVYTPDRREAEDRRIVPTTKVTYLGADTNSPGDVGGHDPAGAGGGDSGGVVIDVGHGASGNDAADGNTGASPGDDTGPGGHGGGTTRTIWHTQIELPYPEPAEHVQPETLSFTAEAAKCRGEIPGEIPSIRPDPTYKSTSEQYNSREATERSFADKMRVLKDSGTRFYDTNLNEIAYWKGMVQGAALSHNADVARTLDFAKNAGNSLGDFVVDFKTAGWTADGIRLRKLGDEIADAWKVLPTKFAGPALKSRAGMLKKAGAALQLADALFAEGDADSGAYWENIARTVLDITLALTPVVGWIKNIQEAVTGYNIALGRELTTTERGFAIFGAVTGGFGNSLTNTHKALKTFSRFFAAQEGSQAAKRAMQVAYSMIR